MKKLKELKVGDKVVRKQPYKKPVVEVITRIIGSRIYTNKGVYFDTGIDCNSVDQFAARIEPK